MSNFNGIQKETACFVNTHSIGSNNADGEVPNALDNLAATSPAMTAMLLQALNGQAAIDRMEQGAESVLAAITAHGDIDATLSDVIDSQLVKNGLPYMVLPPGYSIHNMEGLRDQRFYPRSYFSTTHWNDYLAYVKEAGAFHADTNPATPISPVNSINPTNPTNPNNSVNLINPTDQNAARGQTTHTDSRANSIMTIDVEYRGGGNVAGFSIRAEADFDAGFGFGHGLNKAVYNAQPTDVFAALYRIADKANVTQRELIDLCYDYPEQLMFFDAAGEQLTYTQALDAFAKVSVEVLKAASQNVEDFAEERSISEKAELKAAQRMVNNIVINDPLVLGMNDTLQAVFRLSTRVYKAGEDTKLSLALRLQGRETLIETLTTNMVKEARARSGIGSNVYRGVYDNR